MAIQVSYPGVYIEEFTPGAPIEGVGTNTAAFVGTATSGPIKKPTPIQSWDAFVANFGDFIAGPPAGFLAPAVYGFFLNGGTTCYVVRAAMGAMASAGLDSRQSGTSPAPTLVARARREGVEGNNISVQVTESSVLAELLKSAGSTDKTLTVRRAEADVQAVATARKELTVSDNKDFAARDRVLLAKGTDKATAIVESKQGTNKLMLVAPIAGNVDFAGGKVRSADLAPGQRTFRIVAPNALSLGRALPRGTTVSITLGTTSESHTVESAGGDTLTLTEGLSNSFSLEKADNLPQVASLEFDLTVTDVGTAKTEKFERLSMGLDHPNYWGAITSELISLEPPEEAPSPMPGDLRPAAKTYTLKDGKEDDRAAAAAEVNAKPNEFLDLLKPYDDIALVCAPGFTDKAVQQALRDHCEQMHDRFAILDAKRDAPPGNGIRDQFGDVRSTLGFAALYYPWIVARNPSTGKDELWPPSGHIAGVYARTDAQRGVHKAPANANIRGALGVERLLTDDEQGPLNLMGINVLRVFRGQSQPMVWGARTTATDRNWQYVNIRRLFLFLEESIQEGINWAIFEPNNLQLWQKLKRTITEFLTRVWRDGALFGENADKAFYVRIDEALNPPSTQALGRLYIEIGVRPTYPAEFIIVRIGIWQGGSEVSEG